MVIKPKALVVDDDEPIRNMISRVLQRDGFAVDTARDGIEAIECLKSNDYRVIVLDLMMPRLDGRGVLEHLEKHCPARLGAVVLATAMFTGDLDVVPVAAILRKPFDLDHLRACARNILAEAGEAGA